jgi:hypothetical protein
MRTLTTTLILIAAAGSALTGQRLPARLSPSPAASLQLDAAPHDRFTVKDGAFTVLGGLGGGVVGGVLGGLLGRATCERSNYETGCLTGIGFGALIGESVGVGAGADAGNRFRGNLPLTVLASVGVAAIGLLADSPCRDDSCHDAVLVAIPIGQLAAVTLLEKLFTEH